MLTITSYRAYLDYLIVLQQNLYNYLVAFIMWQRSVFVDFFYATAIDAIKLAYQCLGLHGLRGISTATESHLFD